VVEPGRLKVSKGEQRVSERSSQRFWLLALAVLALAVEARFVGLEQRSFWFDEAYSVSVGKGDLPSILRFLRNDAHPPLYYVLLGQWTRLFGTSEIAARSLSALLGLLMVPALYAFARRMVGREVALAAAALLGGSALAVRAAQDARMYALLGLLALASWSAFVAALRDRRGRTWALYVVCAALMLYTHYYGFFVLAAQGLYVLGRLRSDRGAVTAAAVAMVCVGLCFLPWLPSFLNQATSGRGWPTFRPPADLQQMLDLFGLFSFGGELLGMGGYMHAGGVPGWQAVLIVTPFAALAAIGFYRLRGDRAWLLFCYWAVPVLLALIVSQRFNIFFPRYFSFVVPPFALLLAAGADGVAAAAAAAPAVVARRWPALAGLTAMLLVANIPVINGFVYRDIATYDWRGAARLVTAGAGPNDVLLFVPGFGETSFIYYYKGSLPRFQLTPVEVYAMVHFKTVPAPRVDRQWARGLAEHHAYLWIVTTAPLPESAFRRLENLLAEGFDPPVLWDFRAVDVYRLRSRLFHPVAQRP
jgi:mannosyltransferase